MSTADATSDDEFQDALSDPPAPGSAETATKIKSNEETIEEIINENLHLLPEEEKEEEDRQKLGKDQKSCETANETPESAVIDDSSRAEYLEEDINEDELREAEKLLTTEQLEENKEKSEQMKAEGNDHFKNGDALEAIQIYTEALKICPTTYSKERAILYGNRAAAKIKMQSTKSAIDDCSEAIKLWPDYVRVRIRRAKLYETEDQLDLALQDFKHVTEIDRDHAEARASCMRLTPIVNERNEKLKEEMIAKFKDLGNMILKPFGLSTSNFQMQQDPATGSYSINFNQNTS